MTSGSHSGRRFGRRAAAGLALLLGALAAVAASAETVEYRFDGVVEPRQRVELANRVSGVVTKIHVAGGERVEQGAVLFELDPSAFRIDVDIANAAVAEARARLALAEDAARRQATLLARGTGTTARANETALSVEIARAALAQRAAELAAAELNLDRTRVRAPITGVVGRPRVAPGAFVEAEAGTVLGEIVSLDPLLVAYSVPHATRLAALQAAGAADPNALFAQLTLTLELPSGQLYPHAGRPVFESVAADTGSGALTTWAEFPNPDGVLVPGLTVRVRSTLIRGSKE